jgi:hypothetical protein
VPAPKTLALRLRGRDRIELFEKMVATVKEVHDGSVLMRLETGCRRVIVFVTLDFGQERLVSDPLTDMQKSDDGTPEAAKALLDWAQLYRGWYGGNGVIELWDIATERRIARSQPYLAPVNSRFPHDEFEKMEAGLRARAGISEQE